MIDHFPLPLQGRPERRHLYKWIKAEEEYVAKKFDKQRDDHDTHWGANGIEDFWSRQIVQYLDRANAFLLEAVECEGKDKRRLQQLAQQALAKGMMTFKGCVESSIREFGPLPKPGVSSGEILYWFDPSLKGVVDNDGEE